MRFQFLFSAALAASLLLPSSITRAQKNAQPAQRNAKPAQKNQAGFPGLISALKKSPGCLGLESARTSSGKNVIFCWFKDKKSVMAWYYSDAHQILMGGSFPGVPTKNLWRTSPMMSARLWRLLRLPSPTSPNLRA